MTELLLGKRVSRKRDETRCPNPVRHYGVWRRVVTHFTASWEARKIIKGLNEARQIQSGKKRATTFDDFLNEL